MSIIILFIATCVAFTYLGWGVRDILDVKYELPVGSALALGFASSNLLFFICYLIIQDAITATVIVVGLMSILNFCRVLTIKLSSSERIKISIPNTARFWIPFTLFSITVIFSSTSYLQSGLGAYWHTANEDVFDGLNGRNAYLTENLLAAETQLDVGVRLGGELSQSLARDTGIDEKEIDSDVLKRRYIGSTGFLQYSSLAFYSILFFIPMGIDAFMLQALLNLGLFSIGVYSCARSIFEQSARSAFLAAIIATLGQFYFATFLNGHVGSMMYNAIVPFLLYGAIRFEQSSGYTWRTLLLLAILLLFILGAYPFPLPFIATPFLIYLGIKRNKKEVLNIYHLSQRFPILLQVLLGILGLVLLFILAYWIADPIRERALSQFRSWGTILNHVGFLQFWGIWPSQLANTATPLSLLDAQPFVKGVSIVVSLSISAVSCYGCWIFIREKNGFMLSAIPLFILFFFLMRFPVYDSYYVYKYLYINSWVLYVAAVAGFAALFTVSKIWVRYLVVLVFLVWAGSNSVHNVMAFSQISHKDYNEDFGLYSVLLTAPRALLEQSYIAIPVIDKADLVRQILAENQIITEHGKGRAEYFITMKDHQSTLYENYGNLVWESDLFAIVASPIADVPEFASY
ncbi:MAG: hypothetical protein RLP12_14035, partial [Ekhidna sp.]